MIIGCVCACSGPVAVCELHVYSVCNLCNRAIEGSKMKKVVLDCIILS